MIVPDDFEPTAATPTPRASDDHDDYMALAGTLTHPDGVVSTSNACVNCVDNIRQAETLIGSAVDSVTGRMWAELLEGERLANVAVNTFIGHAGRLCDEAMDSADRLVKKCLGRCPQQGRP